MQKSNFILLIGKNVKRYVDEHGWRAMYRNMSLKAPASLKVLPGLGVDSLKLELTAWLADRWKKKLLFVSSTRHSLDSSKVVGCFKITKRKKKKDPLGILPVSPYQVLWSLIICCVSWAPFLEGKFELPKMIWIEPRSAHGTSLLFPNLQLSHRPL